LIQSVIYNKGIKMFIKNFTLLSVLCFLAACETPVTNRYSISADNNIAIKTLGATGIGIKAFEAPADFSANCRALGALQVADNLTHTQYIQKAFEDEMKIAGAFAPAAARVTIGGKVNKLSFSSVRALTGGTWNIDLTLSSSNGQSMNVVENYDFASGFIATEACRQTADAYSRAVQNLIGKVVRSPDFSNLVR
jgi:hypothetical protein